jgi:hypothetical protein
MFQLSRQKNGIHLSMIIGLLLVFGLYFPTTASQHLSVFSVSAYLVCLALLSVLFFRSRGHVSAPACIVLLSITPLLLVFTSTSGLPTLRLGALLGYGVLSVLLTIDLSDILLPEWFGLLWVPANIINIAAGFAIVAGVQQVNDFIISHYSLGYDELLPNMLALHKPVLTFGSHSIAAFFLYLFFWINLQAYKVKRNWWLLAFSVCYLLLIAFLLSVSALAFVAIGTFQLAAHFGSGIRHKLAWVTVSMCLVLGAAVSWGRAFNWGSSLEVVEAILQDPGNGLSGRLLPGGTMYYDVEYLREHPFSPVGTSFREGMMFGDCGPIEYVLRGSLPLLFLMYGGLFYFLRRNLLSKFHAVFLFVAIVMFELGITTLISLRALYLLPVFIVYLNNLFAPQVQHVSAPGLP